MWDFIKYCLYCLGIAISASLGYNPEGMTIKTLIVGFATMATLSGLLIGLLRLIAMLLQAYRRRK